jgi:hypothetical protein
MIAALISALFHEVIFADWIKPFTASIFVVSIVAVVVVSPLASVRVVAIAASSTTEAVRLKLFATLDVEAAEVPAADGVAGLAFNSLTKFIIELLPLNVCL